MEFRDLPVEIRDRADAFVDLVNEEFQFLVDRHGFSGGQVKFRDLEWFKDREVNVRYCREDIRISVCMGLSANGFWLLVRDEKWNQKPVPYKKAITLHQIAQFKTAGTARSLLSLCAPRCRYFWPKAFCEKPGIKIAVKTMGDQFRLYGQELLDGDLTNFGAMGKC